MIVRLVLNRCPILPAVQSSLPETREIGEGRSAQSVLLSNAPDVRWRENSQVPAHHLVPDQLPLMIEVLEIARLATANWNPCVQGCLGGAGAVVESIVMEDRGNLMSSTLWTGEAPVHAIASGSPVGLLPHSRLSFPQTYSEQWKLLPKTLLPRSSSLTSVLDGFGARIRCAGIRVRSRPGASDAK